jgi:hypothetical protein
MLKMTLLRLASAQKPWLSLSSQMVSLLACLVFVSGNALAFSRNDQETLSAALDYAKEFLAEDAKPEQMFYTRSISRMRDGRQPVFDCATDTIARAVKTGKPYFEAADKKIVVVPVYAELLIINASHAGGDGTGINYSPGTNSCNFVYERYSFEKKRFELSPTFGRQTHAREFHSWGGSHQTPRRLSLTVSPDIGNRYVRFKFRVDVSGKLPFHAMPNFPRLFQVPAALDRLRFFDWSQAQTIKELQKKRQQPLDPDAEQFLQGMQNSLIDTKWQIIRVQSLLETLKSVPSFSDIEE